MMLSVAALVVFLVVFAGIAALVLILVLAALRKGRRQTGYNPNAGSDGTWLGPATAMDPAPQGDFGQVSTWRRHRWPSPRVLGRFRRRSLRKRRPLLG